MPASRRHAGGLQDNAGVHRGFRETGFSRRPRRRFALSLRAGAARHPDEGRNPQPPDRHLALPGAATGVGGEIRDEAATGIGGRTKAGLCGFMVSNLRVPELPMPWEREAPRSPPAWPRPLEIMLEGPIGGAGFGNEFGRPQLCGLFRTYEEMRQRAAHPRLPQADHAGRRHGQHPALDRPSQKPIPPDICIAQIGGPAMRIGLGGGAASSMATGSNDAELDFDSVQRGNAEMERRCQEVIDACARWARTTPSSASTTSAPAASPTAAPSWWPTPAAASTCGRPQRRPLDEPHGDLVLRSPGALRAGRGPRPDRRSWPSARASAARSP
jgi:hypothetical protein